jgi:hypothetical protein
VADEVDARARKAQAIADEQAAEARRLSAGASERREAAAHARAESEEHRDHAQNLWPGETAEPADQQSNWDDGSHPHDPRHPKHLRP